MSGPDVHEYPIDKIYALSLSAASAELELLRFAMRNGVLVDPTTLHLEEFTDERGTWWGASARGIVLLVPSLPVTPPTFRRPYAAGGWPPGKGLQ